MHGEDMRATCVHTAVDPTMAILAGSRARIVDIYQGQLARRDATAVPITPVGAKVSR